MLIQYPDVEERRQRLAELLDVENRVWVQAGETEKLFALADEDLERANDAIDQAAESARRIRARGAGLELAANLGMVTKIIGLNASYECCSRQQNQSLPGQ